MPSWGGTALGPATMTEEEALELCRKGEDGPDHAAFRVLYEQHRRDVGRFLGRLLQDPHVVEDALQDTFVRLHRALKGHERGRPLRPYVFAIARNVALNHLRARSKTKGLDALPGEPAARGGGAEARDRSLAIDDALEALEAQHRSLILLRFTHRLSQDELAQALDCTARTVRNRLRVASSLFERELVKRGVLSQDDASPREVLS